MTLKSKALETDPEPEVLDLSNLKPVSKGRSRKPKLWPWALIGLILLSSGTIVGIEKSIGNIPRIGPSPPSTTTISTTKTPTPPTTSTTTPTAPSTSGSTPTTTTPTPPPPPPPAGSTVTFVHGTANMGTVGIAQTIEFSGGTAYYVSVNYDPNSINYRQYSVYLPNGSYGVAIWQNSLPSDTRPYCTSVNGSVSPFVVNGQSEQLQDFSC